MCRIPPLETALLPLRERAGALASTKATPPVAATTTAATATMSHFVAVPTATLDALAR